jgi:phospholipase C
VTPSHRRPSCPAPTWPRKAPAAKTSTVILQSFQLDACFDPNHGHAQLPNNNAWVLTYDTGNMDGACATYVKNKKCTSLGALQYTYVDNAPAIHTIQPYFDVARNYGYANYMFQTNQGPSFVAHQFLLSGTSAPLRLVRRRESKLGQRQRR